MALNEKWSVVFSEKADRQFQKLDKSIQKQIIAYLEKVLNSQNPRSYGSALHGNLKSYWRYRAGDYRILCQLKNEHITITVVKIAHRREVYQI